MLGPAVVANKIQQIFAWLLMGGLNRLQIPEKVGVPLMALTEILQCACLSLARVRMSLVSSCVSGVKAVE